MSTLYVTATEWQNWPTGLDTQDLIPGGTAAANLAQLQAVIVAACSNVEQITYQPLYCRQVTETTQARGGAGGQLQVRLRAFPATSILAAQWKQSTAGGWQSILVANTQITGALSQQYWADDQNYRAAIGLAGPALTVVTQFLAGYPNAVLRASCTAGASTLTVDDATGMAGSTTLGALTIPGTSLTLYDIPNGSGVGGQETVTVSAVSGNTLSLLTPTVNAHAVGVRASALPYAITEATMYLVNRALKEKRDGGAMVLGAGALESAKTPDDEDTAVAHNLLRPFTRRI